LWMAPEVLDGGSLAAEDLPPTDVWSFGCVLYEIWTRELPWWHIKGTNSFELEEGLKAALANGDRPVAPDGCERAPEAYHIMMEACWASAPLSRPSFAQVLANLPEQQ
jgi:serine/threonine protein kinase